MSGAQQLLAGGSSTAVTYVDDVFSTYLYTGNGSTQTITNNIDLSTYGGLVWIKGRNNASAPNFAYDTARGLTSRLTFNTTAADGNSGTQLSSFNSNGFSLGVDGSWANDLNDTYASWTFRKASKFFGQSTVTLGTGNATVSFPELGTLGMVAVKRTDSTGDWYVWHRSLTAGKLVYLNQTAAEATLGHITVSGTTVTLVDGTLADGNYVVYAWAHDTATDGIIQCGSFTTDGSGNATVTLGWEPQYVIVKPSSTTGNWLINDVLRGWENSTASSDRYLLANTSGAEAGQENGNPTATGFTNTGYAASQTYIYLAIRRPNKPPTSGTQVFMPTVYTGTNADNRHLDTTIAPDMVWIRQRNDAVLGGMVVGDRLRGQPYLLTGTTAAEVNDADSFDQQLVSAVEYGTAFSSMSGIWIGNDATSKLNANTTASNHVVEAFKRAPGVFDIVAYTGTGSATTVAHSLGVVPEMIIVKRRSDIADWPVYTSATGTNSLFLDTTTGSFAGGDWNLTAPTNSVFSVGSGGRVNGSANTYVAYLFATKAGISKVFSYTGNGSSQTIDCGFAAGARFILIKRTDSTGDWYVYDTARGINAGNDPHLSLNTTAAEVNTTDDIDSDNSGFIVNQNATTNLNVTSATYIGLAFA